MFKIIVLCACLGFAAALSRNALGSLGGGEEAHAEILSQKSDVREDGFNYAYETSNGIKAQASGDEHGNIHGDFSYISHEGYPVQLSYVADEEGYQPSSDVLPTPPPIPYQILKSLEYIRSHPQHEERSSGGSYKALKSLLG